MILAAIQPVEMTMFRVWVPVIRCGPCGQQMPADHDHTAPNTDATPSQARPEVAETAPTQ